jgi:prevent-host-death family protein
MAIANVYEAKTHLSRLLRRVRAGEEIIIADAGRPVARLVPIAPPNGPRVLGGDEDLVSIADDFDAPLPDAVINAFYAGSARDLQSDGSTRRKRAGAAASSKRRAR